MILWVTDLDIFPEKSQILLHLSDEKIIKTDEAIKFLINSNDELYCYPDEFTKVKFTRKSYNFLINYITEEKGNFFIQVGKLKLPIN